MAIKLTIILQGSDLGKAITNVSDRLPDARIERIRLLDYVVDTVAPCRCAPVANTDGPLSTAAPLDETKPEVRDEPKPKGRKSKAKTEEPAPAPQETAPAQAEAASEEITVEVVRKALSVLSGMSSSDHCYAVIQQATGQAKLAAVVPAQYPALLKAVEAEIAARKAA